MHTPTQQKPAVNRRAVMRRPARRCIRLECRRGSLGLGANLGTGCIDISISGVQLATKDPLKCGEEVEVVLESPGIRGSIKRIGEVRWTVPLETGGCRAGVRFSKYLTYRELQSLVA
jgi:hypothetical protein